jgi:hypothetical protein
MAFKTLGELVVSCEKRLSEVAGTAVQVYSEDTLAYLIQEAFDFATKQLWWDHLMVWEQRVLDGVNGRVTADITSVQDYENIRAVFREGSDRPLPTLPRDLNPFTLNGTTPQYISADVSVANRHFNVWPKTATGNVYIHGKTTRAADFTADDVVSFDEVAIINYVCWKASSDDGANPGQIEDFKITFSQRMKQLIDDYNSKPIQLDPATGSTSLYGWQEMP